MAINLEKGQTINLDKEQNDLSSITIGLGWKIQKKKGLMGKLRGGGEDFDLDAICIMLNDQGMISVLGDKLVGGDVIFFNNLTHRTGLVVHTGDNLVGGAGVQDDEQIIVKLNSLPQEYSKIVFFVNIYQGNQKKQHFGQVGQAFMRAVDAKGKEIARYSLAEDPAYANMCTMVFGEVYRHGGGWKFRAIGDAYTTDNLVDTVARYVEQ